MEGQIQTGASQVIQNTGDLLPDPPEPPPFPPEGVVIPYPPYPVVLAEHMASS